MQLSRLSKFIFISLLFCWSNTQAGWWNNFIKLVTDTLMAKVTTPTYHFGDPNNPGINGGGTYTPNYSKILPPYNRQVGRGSTGYEANCLYNFRLAGDGEVYQRTCAQDPGDNSATKHKIKMRNVVCFGGCWYEHFELDALKGECNFFSTSSLIISKRVCARIASPPSDGYSADPGYMQGTDSAGRTRGQYLDTYGVSQWDDLVADQNGTSYAILRPKICAYDDPWLLDLWTVADPSSYGSLVTAAKNLRSGNGSLEGFLNIPLDIFDMNPISQPFHGGSGVTSPIANLLITLLQFYQTYQLMGPEMLELIVSMLAQAMGISTNGSKIMDTLFSVVNFILTYQVSTVLAILQANSQVNKYAYANYGCVNIPLGDYPPNYCPTSATIVTGLLDSICSTDSSGNLYQNCYGATSTQTGQTTPYNLCSSIRCVQSNYDNNFLNNTIRIGYTYPVQVCSTTLTTNCVNISGSLTRTSAMANSNFVLGSGISLLGIDKVTVNSTKQYRVLYQVLNSDQTQIVEISNYSYVDLPDCGGTTNGYTSPTGASVVQSTQFCQSVWGVDLGEYSDSFNISVSPTTTAPTGPLSTSSSPVSLSYVDVYSGASFNNKFYVQINQQTEDYSHICAYQTYPGTSYADNQIGCIPRSSMPTPTISSCSTATHVSPCATLSWTARGKTGTNYTANATMTVPQFTSDWSSLPADPVLYLGGASFSSHVVDSSNLTIPYQPTDPNDIRIVSYNGTVLYNSVWGNYLSSIVPSSTCSQDTCAIYLNGLEYMGGHYVRGGSYLCIDNTNGCGNDTTQCILAKNYTAFDGTTTWTSISPSDRVNPNTTSASLTSSQYYTYDGTSTLPSNQNVRSKIGLENSSMCVTVPPATCSVSTDGSTYYSDWSSGTSYYYMATWPSSNAGTLATGSCLTNYLPVDSSKMSRYCFLQSTGTTVWDTTNSRVSSTFGGCMPSCITNVSTSYTSNGVTGGTVTSTNTTTTKSTDGGTILIYTPNGVGNNGIFQSGTVTNTITISFNISSANNSDATKSDIYFTDLQFDDYIQVSVTNGSNVTTQITTDSNTINNSSGTSFVLWNSAASPTEVNSWRSYKTLDTNLSNLNAALLNALSSGNNTITIKVKTVGGGGFYIGMKYNQLCYSQCPSVTSASSTTGNATWTKAAVGGVAAGTCATGYTALDSTKMSRTCNLVSSAGQLDTLTNGVSTSFGGCLSGCISNVIFPSGYPTQSGVTSGGSNTATNTIMTNGGGVVNFASASGRIWGSGTQNTWKVSFDVANANYSNIYLSTLAFDDGVRVKLINSTYPSGLLLTSDSTSISGYALWPSVDTGLYRYYNTYDTNYTNINTLLKNNLVVGTNTIQIEHTEYGAGDLSAILNYSAKCLSTSTCRDDGGGFATWTEASVGGTSTGTCADGYTPSDTSKMSRSCALSSGYAKLETVVNGITSTNFAGCTGGCVYNMSFPTPTQTYVYNGAVIKTTNNSSTNGGGTIYFHSTTGQSCCSTSGSNVVTSWYFDFYLRDASKANLYFSKFIFDDSGRVKITNATYPSGTTVSNDSATLNGYAVWYTGGTGEVGITRNYSTVDAKLATLNSTLKSKLVTGYNRIEVQNNTGGGGFGYATLQYNTNCLNTTTRTNDNGGNASWTSAAVNAYSTGTCDDGYAPSDSTKMTRLCSLSGSYAQLENVIDGTASSTINGTATTTFSGCVSDCMYNISFPTPTQNSMVSGYSNFTTNASNSDGSGTITMQSSSGTSCCAVSGSNISNSWYFDFYVRDKNKANLYFSNFFFDDSGRIKVTNSTYPSGTNITNDNATLNGYALWYTGGTGEVGITRNYTTLDSNLTSLNTAIKNALVVGYNRIQVDHNTGGGGFMYATLQYNTNCMSTTTCANDDAANATWTSASVGSYSTGTCDTNYLKVNAAKMSRLCSTDSNGYAQLERVVGGASINGNFSGCSLGTCSNDNAGHATWSTANAGSLSTGTCNSGYSASGSMTRYCQTNTAQTSTYLDSVSADSGYNSGTSSGTGASFQGCIADRINQISAWNSNNNWSGCTTDIKTWWSGSTYYLSFNTCYGWGNNGIFINSGTTENQYYIKFYVPTSAAKSTVSITQLDFDDFARVYVDQGADGANLIQITQDNVGVYKGSTPYVLWGTTSNGWNSGDVGGWRHYSDGQSLSSLSSSIQGQLSVGWNIIRTDLKTVRGGGIYVTYQFNNPY